MLVPRPHARSVIALVALMAVLAGAVGARHHVSVEIHAPCEQGGTVHVERVSQEVALTSSGTSPFVAEPIWWQVDGDPHCTAAAPSLCIDATGTVLFTWTAVGWDAAPVLAVRKITEGAIYRLAPKTSPPMIARV